MLFITKLFIMLIKIPGKKFIFINYDIKML